MWVYIYIHIHTAFAMSYDEALCNFYTFIQPTVRCWQYEGEFSGQGIQCKNSLR